MLRKKFLALALSATMMVGSVVPVMAAGNTSTGTGSAPIWSFNVTEVVVPTTVTVAFNPDELSVKLGSTTTTDQVLSLAYGVTNKGSKDMTCKVDFELTDANDKITFASTADDVTNAAQGDYVLFLQATPTTVTETVDKDTNATALAALTADTPDTSKAVTLAGGTGSLGLSLEKGDWKATAGSEPTVGTTTDNDVSSSFELNALGAAGYQAFTFTGSMSKTADWSVLTQGITIGLTYTWEETVHANPSSPVYGAVELVTKPKFTASTDLGTINYTKGLDDAALKSIDSITMLYTDGEPYNVYAARGSQWSAATVTDTTIKIDARAAAIFADTLTEGATTAEATITYTMEDGTTETATVDLVIKETN